MNKFIVQSANLTASIVWDRFSYEMITTANYRPYVDDRLPFYKTMQHKEILYHICLQTLLHL